MDFVLLGLFALVVTKLVDSIRNAFDPDDKLNPAWWNILAFTIGVAVCITFEVNLLVQFATSNARGLAGEIITGLLFGAGGSVWHEFLEYVNAKTKLIRRSEDGPHVKQSCNGRTKQPRFFG